MTFEVACGATPSYLAPATAMLHSLLQHTPRRPLRVSLMVEELPPPAQRAWIAGVVEAAGACCQFLEVDPARLAGFPTTPPFHRSVWHRVLPLRQRAAGTQPTPLTPAHARADGPAGRK